MNQQQFIKLNPKGIIKSNESIKENFTVTYSKIETDNGLRRLYGYQHSMLTRIINSTKTYISNQSHALYSNYKLEKPLKVGDFEYNMLLLENSEIYLHNITTSKFRRIHYKMKYNGSRKRRR
jgi:hypothetical protein